LNRPRDRRAAAALAAIALLTASCAGRAAFVVPRGPGVPAADAATIWSLVAAACRSTTSYRSEFALTGQIGDRRIRGLASARLFTALASNGSIGLEATVSGQLLFRVGGATDKAVLLLRDGNRIATARPEEILEALIGVPVSPGRLLAIVSGCVTTAEPVTRAARHEGLLEVVTADGTVYLAAAGTGWQARAGRFGGSLGAGEVLVDYGPFVGGLPREIRIASSGAGKAAVSLNLRVQAVQTNIDLDPALFRVTIPDGATTISLEELRQTGPLAEEANSR
jgi:hypothetical protein